jgi:hypothetical protein
MHDLAWWLPASRIPLTDLAVAHREPMQVNPASTKSSCDIR